MSEIEGKALKANGEPIDWVILYDWDTGDCLGKSKPNELGDWAFTHYTNLKCGITYVAHGCEPISHGPYVFEFTGAKWWRLANIIEREYSHYIAAVEIVFYDKMGNEIVVNPAYAISKSTYNNVSDGEFAPASKAFDHNPSTWAGAADGDQEWWIGASFDTPVFVWSVGTIGRKDLPIGLKREWQTADIEVSDDGITWVKIGTISPRTPPEDSSLIVSPIVMI